MIKQRSRAYLSRLNEPGKKPISTLSTHKRSLPDLSQKNDQQRSKSKFDSVSAESPKGTIPASEAYASKQGTTLHSPKQQA